MEGARLVCYAPSFQLISAADHPVGTRLFTFWRTNQCRCLCGLVGRISISQPADPGSIPGCPTARFLSHFSHTIRASQLTICWTRTFVVRSSHRTTKSIGLSCSTNPDSKGCAFVFDRTNSTLMHTMLSKRCLLYTSPSPRD